METSFKKSSGNPNAVNSTFINNGIAYSHVNIGFNKIFLLTEVPQKITTLLTEVSD